MADLGGARLVGKLFKHNRLGGNVSRPTPLGRPLPELVYNWSAGLIYVNSTLVFDIDLVDGGVWGRCRPLGLIARYQICIRPLGTARLAADRSL